MTELRFFLDLTLLLGFPSSQPNPQQFQSLRPAQPFAQQVRHQVTPIVTNGQPDFSNNLIQQQQQLKFQQLQQQQQQQQRQNAQLRQNRLIQQNNINQNAFIKQQQFQKLQLEKQRRDQERKNQGFGQCEDRYNQLLGDIFMANEVNYAKKLVSNVFYLFFISAHLLIPHA